MTRPRTLSGHGPEISKQQLGRPERSQCSFTGVPAIVVSNYHKAVRQQGRDLAAKLGVTPTPPKDFAMTKDHAEAMQKLRALHGAAFDRAFLAHEVAYHKAVLDAVTTTLLPALQNAEVKDLVTKVEPAFNAHMVRAQSLLDAYTK